MCTMYAYRAYDDEPATVDATIYGRTGIYT